MKAPDYWRQGRGGVVSTLLRPFGWLYNVGSQMNQATTTPLQAAVPVVCVGNVVAGGAGKTPVAIDIGKRLSRAGIDLNFLSRGYGGSEVGPHRVDDQLDRAERVGDEPLLLSKVAPTWIAKDRIEGAGAVIGAGAKAIVLDDGLQNPALYKDLSFCVIDGTYGLGNDRVMPAGPLRETLEDALKKTTAVVLMGEDIAGIDASIHSIAPQMTVLKAVLQPDTTGLKLAEKPVHAFAGIGHPEKFFKTLQTLKCDLRETISYPDHHLFNSDEISKMVADAKTDGAILVTTEKDYVRLDPKWHDNIVALPVTVNWQDEAQLESLLRPLFFDSAEYPVPE